MIRSMTGFGAASSDDDGARCSVELRSVNSRFFKAILRLPDSLLSLEGEIESQVGRRLLRGSVAVSVRFVDASERAAGRINVEVLRSYLKQFEALAAGAAPPSPAALLSLPGAVIDDASERLAARARPIVAKLIDQACEGVLEMRRREGESLRRTLEQLAADISRGVASIRQRAPEVSELYRARLVARMKSMLEEVGGAVRDEDVIREVAAYAERTDVAEEVARLEGHLEQLRSLLDPANPEPVGRTLDFLAQEMLREANTVASKSADVEISRRIVEVKSAIDRIKEQSQNAE
ncbi:MAG: YicC family protein [Phycisphaerae bacterium]|nr:YicC family protein [Phycisphaerae bacterium]